MKTIEEIREFFKGDRVATDLGCYIESIDDHGDTIISMPIDERHMNARGFVMGGVYFSIADFAMAVATNSFDRSCVSLSASINFLNGVKGDKLIAVAKPIKDGSRTCCYDITIKDNTDRDVAVVTIQGFYVG